MKDRKKFQTFAINEKNQATLIRTSTEAIKKEDEAANPMDGERSMGDKSKQMGRAMRVDAFIAKLKSLNPKLIFELSKGDPTKYGIYIPVGQARKLVDTALAQDIVFICGMESGINLGGRINEGMIPEFSIMVTKDVIVPDGDSIKKKKKFESEIRGWRRVLAALISDGYLTEPQVVKAFDIATPSQRWQQKVNPTITV